MDYYHGGVPGLRVGQKILPAQQTGAKSCGDYVHYNHRMDRVYVTTDRDAATVFAAMHPSGRGVVYRVQPEGDIEPDPDCRKEGLAFQCTGAVIKARSKVPGKVIRNIQKWMQETS
jgi:rifampin ADP-ribosylating transferase